ncbi:hypothetical protein Tco_0128644 [Tanacetum coccineum]
MSSNTSDYIYPIIIPSDFEVEGAFSSTNTLDYTLTSPDYSPASPGNISPDPSDDLSKYLLASLAILHFHDDPYMKVMQACNATSNELPIPLPYAPITPSIVLPLSPVLPLFDPQDFFLPEEILHLKNEPVSYHPPLLISLPHLRTSTLEILIEDIQVRHRSDTKNLLDKIHKLKNHKGGPPPPDY